MKKRTYEAYEPFCKLAVTASRNVGMDRMQISTVKKGHIRLLLDEIGRIQQDAYDKKGKGKKFSNTTYNKYKRFISSFLTELEEWDAMECNPAKKLKKKDQAETGMHRHATDEEIKAVKEYLQVNNPGLYDFLRYEYVTGMRPDEMMRMRFNMIDWRNSYMKLSYAEGKTKIYREVPLPGFLLEWLRERLQGCSPDDYIFSRSLQGGPHKATRNWVSIMWRDTVKIGMILN